MPESQIGVLIDYENVGLMSIRPLFDQLSDMGRIIIKRAYADWSKATPKNEQMLELGIEAKHYFHPPGSGKNASDICLAIDATELLYRSPVDTFVIVSSDTDFIPLVSTLRSAGKVVIGAGRRGAVSPGLVRSCDRYIFLDEGEQPTAQAHSDLQQQAQDLLRRSVEASVDDQGQVVAAKLHSTLLRMDPSFDFRTLGYRTFTQFLTRSPLVNLHRPRGRGDILVELAQGHNQTGRSYEPEASRSHEPEASRSHEPEASRSHEPEASRSHEPEASRSHEPEASRSHEPEANGGAWDVSIDAAWSMVPGNSIAGSKAAAEAAKVLGATKVSASRYKNLQGLLEASELLRSRWRREGNAILRLGDRSEAALDYRD